MLINVAIPGDRNVIKKEAEMVRFRPCNRITAHVECKNKSDTSNNGGKWNLLKIILKIPDKQTGRTRNADTAVLLGNAYVISKSINVQIRNTQRQKYRCMYQKLKLQKNSNTLCSRKIVCFKCFK
jgi:hypothetical protein